MTENALIIEQRLQSSGRLPYRISLLREGETVFVVHSASRWPATNSVFCLREGGSYDKPQLGTAVIAAESVELERLPVHSVHQMADLIIIILEQPNRKRCQFRFTGKLLGSTRREKVFWETQKTLAEKKPRTKLTVYRNEDAEPPLIIIDSSEKTPWTFPGCRTINRKLKVGDYALEHSGEIVAIVERKTRRNLFTDLSRMSILHQQLMELAASATYCALVIETEYGDLLRKKQDFYNQSFLQKALGEIDAMHPTLKVVPVGGRRDAELWALQFFNAIQVKLEDVRCGHNPLEANRRQRSHVDERTKAFAKDALDKLPANFDKMLLLCSFPDIPWPVMKKVVTFLTDEGHIKKIRAAGTTAWEKL